MTEQRRETHETHRAKDERRQAREKDKRREPGPERARRDKRNRAIEVALCLIIACVFAYVLYPWATADINAHNLRNMQQEQ
jgi:hypothetical protein